MSLSPTPRIPWEIIERVIDHAVDSTRTLYSLTLTCSNLRPRGTIVLFYHLKPKNRDQLFIIHAVLQANPHLQPCVRLLSIPSPEFSPHPLLRMLPNLSEINLEHNGDRLRERPIAFHPSVLKYCHQFGKDIRTLSLRNIRFFSPSAFLDILLSLPRVKSLSCDDLHVKKDNFHQDLTTRRLSDRLYLSALTVGELIDKSLYTLLRKLANHRVEVLACALGDNDSVRRKHFIEKFLGSPSDWVKLTSLTWNVTLPTDLSDSETLGHIIAVLKHFRPPNVRDVAVVFPFSSFGEFLWSASQPSASELCAELEDGLMTTPQPTVSFSSGLPINSLHHRSWMDTLEELFPALAERRVLKIVAEYSVHAGHSSLLVSPIAISTDSKWAATGSADGTIIVWDLQSECISQQWYAVENGPDSLAFSPDGRYLMSASRWAAARRKGATIWDLRQGARRVKSLEAGAGSSPRSPLYLNCVWAPDGSWVATGAQEDGAVRIWETTTGTFQRLPSTVREGSELLAVSADGRWIVTGGQDFFDRAVYSCWIRSVDSGKVHRTLRDHTDRVNVAAFNPGCTRVVTGSVDSTVRLWDAESGDQLLVMRDPRGDGIDAVAFSGDGRMVLSHVYGLLRSARFNRLGDTSDHLGGGVKVWDASNGALLASLSETRAEHYSTPHTACFSPCGGYLASASNGTAALLWRTSDWSCIAELSGWSGVGEVTKGRARVTNVAFSPDGMVLCWGNEAGMVFFRRVHDIISANQHSLG